MGIVMAAFMALAIVMAWPWSRDLAGWRHRHATLARTAAIGVMMAGVWNALWHGLRHLGQFWGQAAMVSGLLMMAAAALLLLGARQGDEFTASAPTALGGHFARTGALLLVPALVACFLLYAITLVRLNLGLSIPG